jgi:glutathione S-transferase
MKLIGQYDSPYTRRVAISLKLAAVDFEHVRLSVFADGEEMRKLNPLGRIPVLALEDGEVLIDSGAILDWLDETVGPSCALVPVAGVQRRRALRIIAFATGAIDKAMGVSYERFRRPAEKIYEPWIARLQTQLESALDALNQLPQTPWLMGGKMSQPDITVAAMVGYIRCYLPELIRDERYRGLAKLARVCEALPVFQDCLPSVEDIGGPEVEATAALLRLQGKGDKG